ncbi:hypothetical protein P43SY_004706 [Pythium insidiosum]|uniref:Steroid 5-alpha reductase C-terminal domain-containing protein n=1 Tax=Pythium insidiosum TaxID=114742 RepID=A0AAD5LT61_PYTIN|nr:hypothetical protein P43SY_004706 [Pythium insidiosum]
MSVDGVHPLLQWQSAGDHVAAALREAVSAFPLSYTSASALAVGLQLVLVVIFGCWLASVLTHNYSHVDRLWSIVPFVYVWHFAVRAFLDDQQTQWNARLVLMAALSTLWGLRLTFNFWRKGGYSLQEEDYRWAVLRQLMHPVAYQIFNVVFIAAYQNALLFLIAAPAYVAYSFRSTPLGPLDALAAVLLLALLALETVADQQQWVFYQTKRRLQAQGKLLTGDYQLGFNRSGLFRFSRHPNFFAEQGIWCTFYLFSVAASGALVNPSVLGAVLLVLLFQGSTAFTEYITVRKYPAYRAYQQSVSRLVPWFPHSINKRVD